MTAPLVTIGVPLYRAGPFVDALIADMRAQTWPNLEILFADQHRLDDAADRLAAAFADDPRVRVIQTTDALPWWENYSFLLHEARGAFFRLLAQDDRLPPGSVDAGAQALAADPAAMVAYGPVDVIDGAGATLRPGLRTMPLGGLAGSRMVEPLGVFAGVLHPEASLGLIRTAPARAHGLRIEETHGHTGLSFRAFLFAMALCGPFRFVPGYRSARRVHATSFTSRQKRRGPAAEFARLTSYFRLGLRYWRTHAVGGPRRWMGAPALALGLTILPLVRMAQRLTPSVRRQFRERRGG